MIEIVHTWKPEWSYFTIASLIDKDEDYRLHLYVEEEYYKDLPINWIFDNIPNVRIYEAYWKKDYAARAIQHLRLHWKDKGLHKRILYAGGNRIFLKTGWTDEIQMRLSSKQNYHTYQERKYLLGTNNSHHIMEY